MKQIVKIIDMFIMILEFDGFDQSIYLLFDSINFLEM
jgi:hypothetical protein